MARQPQKWLHADVGLLLTQYEDVDPGGGATSYGLDTVFGGGLADPHVGLDISAETAIFVREMEIKPVVTMVDKKRIGQTHRSPGKIAGKRMCEISFTVPLPEMDATTYARPAFDDLLLSSGFAGVDKEIEAALANDAVDYLPSTFGASCVGQGSLSAFCYVFKDGACPANANEVELWEANGCVFNVELSLVADDESTLKFTGMGLYNRPQSDATYTNSPDWISPDDGMVMVGAQVSMEDFGSADALLTVPITEITFNMNMEVKERPAMNRLSQTAEQFQGGIAGFMITRDGSAGGTIKMEAGLESDYGFWEDVETEQKKNLVIWYNTPGGVYSCFQVPKIGLESPDIERDGTIGYSFPYTAYDYNDAGDLYVGMRFSTFDYGDLGAGWTAGAGPNASPYPIPVV